MRPDKEIFFKTATVQLLAKIDDMKIQNAEPIKDLIIRIRNAFLDDNVRRSVFGTELANDMSVYATNGFCAAASVLFLNNTDADFELMYIDDMWTYGPHHFLRHKPSGIILDLTFDQFIQDGITAIPYDMGCPIKPTKLSSDMALRFATAVGINMKQNKRYNHAKARTVR